MTFCSPSSSALVGDHDRLSWRFVCQQTGLNRNLMLEKWSWQGLGQCEKANGTSVNLSVCLSFAALLLILRKNIYIQYVPFCCIDENSEEVGSSVKFPGNLMTYPYKPQQLKSCTRPASLPVSLHHTRTQNVTGPALMQGHIMCCTERRTTIESDILL